MEPDTLDKVADATRSLAETGKKTLELVASCGRVIKGPVVELAGLLEDRLKFARWGLQLAFMEKANAIMKARGLDQPTRELPLNFVLPLLTTAAFEEDDDLQEVWARLLVNAGDKTTEMELRTAYVEILRGMSALDVKNLAGMAKVTLAMPHGKHCTLMTAGLPDSAEPYSNHFRGGRAIPPELGISLANLARLGCAMPGGGLDGSVLYDIMTVTDLGLALYKACS
jgi:hypothetical protein